MTKILAKSKSGHDKDHYYVVVDEASDKVWLADGVTRTMDHPKCKNRKHIQVIRDIPREAAALLNIEENLTDLTVKRVLKLYQSRNKQEEDNVKS